MAITKILNIMERRTKFSLVQEPLSKKIRDAMNVAVISTLARGRNWGNSGRN